MHLARQRMFNSYRPVFDIDKQQFRLERARDPVGWQNGWPYPPPARIGKSAQLLPSDAWYQLPQQNLILNPVPNYLTVSSADRDRERWPSTSYFRIKLVDDTPGQPYGAVGCIYKNVRTIKLLSLTVPNTNNVLDEPYLLLTVDEVPGNYDSTNPWVCKSIAKIFFKRPGPSDAFLKMDSGVADPDTKVIAGVGRQLDRLTLGLRRYDGTPFDFGTDDGETLDPALQTSFTFELVNEVPDAQHAIGIRTV